METTKQAKVILLPTEKKSKILLGTNGKLFDTTLDSPNIEYLKGTAFQHLYICSDEKIKDGDWFYDKALNKISQAKASDDIKWLNELNPDGKRVCFKIIATTDTSLKWSNDNDIQAIDTHFASLPQPSPNWIKEVYIPEYNEGNKIENVLVEYEWTRNHGYAPNMKESQIEVLRVDSNNEITIKGVKDSWSREEVEKLIYAFNKYRKEVSVNGSLILGINEPETIDKWISKNL